MILNIISIALYHLPDAGIRFVAHAMAVTAFSLLRIRRRLILDNIKIAFVDTISAKKQKEIGYLSVFHFALTVLEFLRERRQELGKNVEILGLENLTKARAKGKGVYILCLHLGNWEAMCSAMTKQVCPSHVIVKKVGFASLDRFVTKRRIENGFFPIVRRKRGDSFKQIVEILGKNEIVGFAFDQARPAEPYLPFFAKPAKTNTSFAAIWRKRPAPILPAYIERVAVGKHILHIKEEIDLSVGIESEKEILEHSKYFNQIAETMIRECPEQYFWMHNRWKR